MVIKKDLIIAVLSTFCLTATLFMIVPTRSSVNPYDPWLDYNGDGRIDMREIGAACNSFGATGDPTKNVNVTNWLPPKPKMVVYHTWAYVYWEDGSVSWGGPEPDLYVGDYTRMSILLKIDDLNLEYGDALFTVDVCWKDPTTGVETLETLSSTLVLLTHDPINQLQGWRQISTASYAIKAPYLSLEPEMINLADKHKGNASISAYIFLTYDTPDDSTLKTIEYEVDRWSDSDYESLSAFFTQGYRQITLRIWTDVSCDVSVVDYRTWSLIDSFSKGIGWVMKTYEVITPSIEIRFSSPSLKPWHISIMVYMTT